SEYRNPMGIKAVQSCSSPAFFCADAWILLGVGWLRSDPKDRAYHVHDGGSRKAKPGYELLSPHGTGAKFVAWRFGVLPQCCAAARERWEPLSRHALAMSSVQRPVCARKRYPHGFIFGNRKIGRIPDATRSL
ncbi:MAG: hypothetical protein ACOC93_03550, partial [Planctomycetota bacterium]